MRQRPASGGGGLGGYAKRLDTSRRSLYAVLHAVAAWAMRGFAPDAGPTAGYAGPNGLPRGLPMAEPFLHPSPLPSGRLARHRRFVHVLHARGLAGTHLPSER